MLEEIIRQVRPACRHEVDRLDGPERDHVVIAPPVTHDTDRTHRQEHGKGLADSVVQVVRAEFLDEDIVGELQQLGKLAPDLAEDAHAEPRARERMPVHHLARETELHADLPDLVLEQLAQRFDELHAHRLGQSTDVVVGLDDVCLAGRRPRGLDDVRINRALREPLDAFEAMRLFVEDLDELAADNLALLFRVGHALERREESIRRIDSNDVDAQVLGERVHDLVALMMAQQAVVDEDADELVADRLVQQRGHDRRVDAAGQSEQYLAVAHLVAHGVDSVSDDVPGIPVAWAMAYLVHETAQNLFAPERMRDFRMELYAVVLAFGVLHRG